MKPCLSEATTMNASFADDVAAYADAGWPAMEVWLTKLEKHLEKQSVSDTKKLVQDRNLTLAAASYQGGLLLSKGEQRLVHYDQFKKRLALCQALDIRTMLVIADFIDRIDAEILDLAMNSLTEAAQLAGTYQVKLALEFQSNAKWCRSVDTAIAFINNADSPHIGVNLDLFHYYTGPSKFEDLKQLNKSNLAFVQVCDLAGLTRDLATDSDRILPGDGDFQLKPIFDHLRSVNYDGWVSVELFSPLFWKMKTKQVAETALASVKRVLEA